MLLQDLASGEGWGTICISIENIEQFDKDIQQKKITTSGVKAAQRKTPNGSIRKWKMLFVAQPVSDELPFPFFMEWEEAEEIRFATLRKDGIILPVNDALEIKECVFQVNDPLTESARWGRLLSQEVSASNEFVLPNVSFKFTAANKVGKDRLSDVIIEPFAENEMTSIME